MSCVGVWMYPSHAQALSVITLPQMCVRGTAVQNISNALCTAAPRTRCAARTRSIFSALKDIIENHENPPFVPITGFDFMSAHIVICSSLPLLTESET